MCVCVCDVSSEKQALTPRDSCRQSRPRQCCRWCGCSHTGTSSAVLVLVHSVVCWEPRELQTLSSSSLGPCLHLQIRMCNLMVALGLECETTFTLQVPTHRRRYPVGWRCKHCDTPTLVPCLQSQIRADNVRRNLAVALALEGEALECEPTFTLLECRQTQTPCELEAN